MPENLCFTAIALEYFTKWIEAMALARITSSTPTSFVWQRIICYFGVPSYITVDNGKQFDCTEFRNFYNKLGIKLAFASVNHPESNRAVKRANRLIFNAVSKSLFDSPKGKWAQELITSVWGHNISRTRTTGFSPFRLLYGEEAITPEELKLGSFCTEIAATTPIQQYVELEATETARLQATSNLDKYHKKQRPRETRKFCERTST